ncbi:MAG: cytochrome c5 family protein [Burkholderiales bacterium]|jgi:cytochrome c5|nr:cytochrome c5 family protein [Burkholderiales bacterium]
MSDNHIPEHSTPIKTPKQLIIVVVLAFVVPVLVIVMLAQLVTSGKSSTTDPAAAEEAVAQRLKPAGEVIVAAAGGAQEVRAGKAVYEAICAACHTTGVLNAPKLGDKGAWAKLIAEGQSKLTADAMKGVRQMPPRGGAPDLSDVEFARAVAYMANQAGANWKEPDAPAAAAAAAPATAVAAATPAAAPAAAAAPSNGKGKSVYESSCTACHAAGVAGAPKTGDKAAWAPRLKAGNSALVAAVVKGKGAMPPKGGNMSLSDDDIKAAVDYMVSLVK